MTSFPSALDYRGAILNPERFVLDPVLQRCRPILNGTEPLFYSGGFARVYLFQASDGTKYALRCWVNDIGDSFRIYHEIDAFIRNNPAIYFADLHYRPESILVNGKRYPGVRMRWIEEPSLKDFLQKYLRQGATLLALAEEFRKLTHFMHERDAAHGDLQPDNIKVIYKPGTAPYPVLIDYDTMYVPALRGSHSFNCGLPCYQHPLRAKSSIITQKDDYFSELVIYLTIIALAQDPSLWQRYEVGDRDKELLFSAEDFSEPYTSEVFKQLVNAPPLVGKLALELGGFCQAPSLDNLSPLAAVISRQDQTKPSIFATGKYKGRGQTIQNKNGGGIVPKQVIIFNQPRVSPRPNQPNVSPPTPPPTPSPVTPTPKKNDSGCGCLILIIIVIIIIVIIANQKN